VQGNCAEKREESGSDPCAASDHCAAPWFSVDVFPRSRGKYFVQEY
jgi:hypothetical protein